MYIVYILLLRVIRAERRAVLCFVFDCENIFFVHSDEILLFCEHIVRGNKLFFFLKNIYMM